MTSKTSSQFSVITGAAQKVADIVGSTLGPGGKPVMIMSKDEAGYISTSSRKTV
jgi:chaperonin GroEL (HSP60 family)